MQSDLVLQEPQPFLESGQRFGRLVILNYSHTNKHRSRCYLCLCDCGTEKTVNRSELKSGRTLSCGCLRLENISKSCGGSKNFHFKHGGSGTKLWRLWHGMHERCKYPRHISYQYYGGKGINVCKEWQDFSGFRLWAASNGYADGMSIDRRDADKDYAPDNCTWVTRSENTARGNKGRIKRRQVSNG